jgi:gluconate 5-dehydrogenase
LSSVLGAHAAIGGVPYQMAKAAIEQMTRALALEVAPRIRVNSVAPGFIRTDMNLEAHTDPAFHQKVARATPLGRWGEPEDVAPAVRYLLSREADWVTGMVLGIDGGITLR